MSGKKALFRIEAATPADRRWMLDRLVETAFLTLGPNRSRGLAPAAVRKRVAEETAGIEGPGGLPNQAFVARDRRGWRAGYVWVAEVREEFTGRRQAFILELYVALRHRRQGLGRLLLAEAERWAQERGLKRIALSVAEQNGPARALYTSLGYEPETWRMGKNIQARLTGAPSLQPRAGERTARARGRVPAAPVRSRPPRPEAPPWLTPPDAPRRPVDWAGAIR